MDRSTAPNMTRSQSSLSNSNVNFPPFPSGQANLHLQNSPRRFSQLIYNGNYLPSSQNIDLNMLAPDQFVFHARYWPGTNEKITIIFSQPCQKYHSPNQPKHSVRTVLNITPQSFSRNSYVDYEPDSERSASNNLEDHFT